MESIIATDNTALEFTSDDAANWRAFLSTRTGQKLIPKIVDSVPGLLAGGELNAILIRSGEARGFSSAVQTLLLLANPEPERREQTSYARLDDDAAWPGTEKLNP